MQDSEKSSVESFLQTQSTKKTLSSPAESASANPLGLIGKIFWIGGLLTFFYAAFFYDATVSNAYAGQVININLVSNKILIAIFGSACFCAGITMHSVSTISRSLK